VKIGDTIAMISCLFVLGCASVSDGQLAALRDSNPVVREKAAQELAKGPSFLGSLFVWFVDEENEKLAVTLLTDMLHQGKEPKTRQLLIIQALGQMGKRHEGPVKTLIEKLQDEDPAIVAEAAAALGKAKNSVASEALMHSLEKKETYWAAVIWALGEIADPKSIPVLDGLLSDQDQFVRYLARIALNKIGAAQKENGQGNTVSVEGDSSSVQNTFEVAKEAVQMYQNMMRILFVQISGIKKA
jgi:HEAT repeat protein